MVLHVFTGLEVLIYWPLFLLEFSLGLRSFVIPVIPTMGFAFPTAEFGSINQLWKEMTYEKLDERYRNSLLMGLEPAREPVPTTMIAEPVAFLDPSRYLWSTLYGVFSKVPLQGVAQPLATHLASSLRVIGSAAPYVGLALYLAVVADGFSSS